MESYLIYIIVIPAAVILIARFIPRLPLRAVLTLALLGVIGYFLLITVAEMPRFGEAGSPAHNEIPTRYLEQGVAETGVINTVSAIITDYRAFDTLGEATVLFVAIAAVIATLKSH
jgi:multisubunit Na+/H+ antiporter MnhB subunit